MDLTPVFFAAAIFFHLGPGASAAQERPPVRCISTSCHSPSLPGAVLHQPVREEQCAVCHFPGEGFLPEKHSSSSFSPAASGPAVCLPCHPATAEQLSGPVLHEPAAADGCGACHRPHASDHPFLLAAPYPEGTFAVYGSGTYSLCWNCHDSALAEEKSTVSSTGFRRGKRNFHYSHLHKRSGMACRACHTLHGGRQAHLIREENPPGGPVWKNGMRFESSLSGGRCIGGCHKDISYSR